MVKDHLKRLAAPKSWPIKRKESKFISRPSPGLHSLKSGIPLCVFLRDILNYAKTTREVKKILQSRNVLVDGVRRKKHRFIVGLMDVIAVSEIKKYYRIILDKKGKISLIEIEKNDASVKPCKITGKNKVKGKTQLNLFDGRNILIDKDDYKVNDTIIISLPNQEIKKHIRFEKNVTVFLTGGKHTGELGLVEDIVSDKIRYKNRKGEVFETLKKYAFVVGKEKPEIKLEK